ncbi:EamA family transporter [Actinoplanes sp. NPDC051494]|uniref:EamA family transporter n=1 Tax=Actinoplanes sp. NPDC051494 TaxID=3363907 RepID=UPI0037A57F94
MHFSVTAALPARIRGDRQGVHQALGLVVAGSISVQVAAAIASGLFAALGPFATSSLRMMLAAVLLCALFRPRLTGRTATQWLGITGYGIAMAAMNLCLYAAIDRLPLGVAVTLDFLGPCAVAMCAARRVGEAMVALAALGGVVLIAGPGGYFDLAGYAFGLAGAFFYGLYTLSAERVGKSEAGLSGLALSVTVAAIVSSPFGLPVAPSVTAGQWLVLAVAAALGVALPFAADIIAARLSSAQVLGTLLSMDPVAGVIVGVLLLGEKVHGFAILGIVLVVTAGAVIAGPTRADSKTRSRATQSPARAERRGPGRRGARRCRTCGAATGGAGRAVRRQAVRRQGVRDVRRGVVRRRVVWAQATRGGGE